MNNKNKILVGCLALLLVLSVGYAIFSDAITINGTATAKGDFNITPTCISGVVLDIGLEEHGYNNEYCTVDDATDTVSFGANFDYPGAARSFTVKMTNTGTINATFPTTVSLDSSNSKICLASTLEQDAETEGECTSVTAHYSNALTAYAVQVGDGTIYDASDTSALPADVQLAFSENGSMVLKPGNSIYYYVGIGAPADISNESGILNSYLKYSYETTFEQAVN